MADFSYGGENYTVTRNADGQPQLLRHTQSAGDVVMRPTDAGLLRAMNQSLATEAGATTPTPDAGGAELGAAGATPPPNAAPPTQPPDVGGAPQGPQINTPTPSSTLTNPTPAVGAQSVPNTASTATGGQGLAPKRGDYGFATQERAQLTKLQEALTEANKRVADQGAATPGDASLIANINKQIGDVQASIQKLETPEDVKIVSGVPTPKQKNMVVQKGGEPPYVIQNPIWDGKDYPAEAIQSFPSGNHVFTFDPSSGHLTLAYTDDDAKEIQSRTLAVAQANAATAKAKAEADASAEASRVKIEEAVMRGEDANSIRAQAQLDLNSKVAVWQNSIEQAKVAQTSLDSYNTERHANAKDRLSTDDYNEKVRAAKATEAYNAAKLASDEKTAATTAATTMRGQDVQASGTKYAADVGAVTARMNAANSMLQAGMTQLAEINKYLPPGSDLAGKALEGLMRYGQKFLAESAGPNPTMPGAPSLESYGLPGLGGPTKPAAAAVGAAAINPAADLTTANVGTKLAGGPANAVDNTVTNVAQPVDQTLGALSTSQPVETAEQSAARNSAAMAAQNGGIDPSANAQAMLNLFNNEDPAAAMFAQNTAAHQQAMNEQFNNGPTLAPTKGLHADGSPLAGPDDVKRIFGRAA